MLRNYLIVGLRRLLRNPMYSAINLMGLAIGLAVCAIIFLWVQDELGYDRFHEKAERIFRVERKVDFRDIHGQAPMTAGPYGQAMVRDYPEVENFCRMDTDEIAIRDATQTYRRQRVVFSDNSIFEIFDFRLRRGDPGSALKEPRTLVLTEEKAAQYFGEADAVGQTLTVDWNGSLLDFQVTGILEKVPANSHVHFEVLASLSTYPEAEMAHWLNNFLYTYVLMRPGAASAELENKLPGFLTRYQAGQYAALLGSEMEINDFIQLKLKPLVNIHLFPAEQFEIAAQGSMTSVMIFSAIALLILVIAGINFMNLSTARAQNRAREVGLRKTVGAGRRQLWGQFLSESILMSLVAAALAAGLIAALLPAFNKMAAKSLSPSLLLEPAKGLMLLGFTLAAGLLAGLYPAFCLTAFEPVTVLKGRAQAGRAKTGFRRLMAVFQFAISISLIIGTLVILRQMDPRILSVAGSSNVPGSRLFSDTVFKRDDSDDIFSLTFLSCDYDFVDTLGFTLLRGRNFSREFSADSRGAVLLNQRAVAEIGLMPEKVVGRKLLQAVDADEFKDLFIIGVVEDFHFKSLHRRIEPLVIRINPENTRFISVRIQPGDVRGTVSFIRNIWEKHFPGEEFNFGFLDDRIDRLYENEVRMRSLFFSFALLSIFVACLGLFGLAAFTAQERTKEIGVRKVLGASVPNLVRRLTWEFTKWVLIANVIAWPAAYIVMHRWVGNFAYRAPIGAGSFLTAAGLALITAWGTVGFQALKTARTDPVRALRWE